MTDDELLAALAAEQRWMSQRELADAVGVDRDDVLEPMVRLAARGVVDQRGSGECGDPLLWGTKEPRRG